MNLYVVDETDN